MSAPPPPPQGSRRSPTNPQLATVFLPTTQPTSVDSRFVYAPWNGHSTHTPQGSPRSIPFRDQCTYVPQEYRISPINPRPVTFAPSTPQTNPYNGRSVYAQLNGNPAYTPQGPPQSDSFNYPSTYAPQGSPHSIPYNNRRSYAPQDNRTSPVNARPVTFAPPTPQTNPYNGRSAYAQLNGNPTYTLQRPPQSDSSNNSSTYASMNGHSIHAPQEYRIPPINAQPEALASPTPQSNQLIGCSSYTPHTPSVSTGRSAHMSGLITSNICDPTNSTRSLGMQKHDLSEVQDDYDLCARIPGLSSAYSGDHATHPQQQMSGNSQSTPDSERPFKCDQCIRSFERKRDLEHHKTWAHVEGLFKCDQCYRRFKWNHHLKNHKKLAHEGKTFKCDQCPDIFGYKGDLKRHQQIHSVVGTIRCRNCGKGYSSISNLTRHVKLTGCGKSSTSDPKH